MFSLQVVMSIDLDIHEHITGAQELSDDSMIIITITTTIITRTDFLFFLKKKLIKINLKKTKRSQIFSFRLSNKSTRLILIF